MDLIEAANFEVEDVDFCKYLLYSLAICPEPSQVPKNLLNFSSATSQPLANSKVSLGLHSLTESGSLSSKSINSETASLTSGISDLNLSNNVTHPLSTS